MPTAQQFLTRLLFYSGSDYKLFGIAPEVFDCSELVWWVCAELGVKPHMPDISWVQAMHCRAHQNMIEVEEGIKTPGALLFRFSTIPCLDNRPKRAHVAVSQGNGRTIEAIGRKGGVGEFKARGRRWTHAGLVPGIEY